eukprot:GDKJ01021219.1.p1 GENE.GDKJ01021219.1~~GDKJ01021219.1.p1  ORF type:complete len:563 (+),score=163.00 GDKJ01021219.1:69-1691(+)
MNFAVDEFGRPFIIMKEQDKKKRLKGLEAHKANISAALQVSNTLRTSLGPRGMDKIIVGPDGDVTVTNDGATILDKMEISHQTARLLVELSKSQDDEIGDGTTGVVIIAGALLAEALKLLDKGLHQLRIADGFERACQIAIKRIEEIALSQDIHSNSNEALLRAAMTSLGSKIVSARHEQMARMAVDAVLAVADLDRRDVNFDLIRVEGKAGGRLEESQIINGIVLDKDLSHPQMPKTVENAKIAILTCPFEPPKPKTKHTLNIKTAEAYKQLQEQEAQYFHDMVKKVKDSGANFVICQWGFDDEANHLLLQNGINAIRWVGGVELELIAISTGGRIIPRFEELSAEKLGFASCIREVNSGTDNEPMIIIEGCKESKTVTALLRGGNAMVIEEARRSLHDAICVVRNLVRESKVVAGGGSCEIACSLAVEKWARGMEGADQFVFQGFADALLTIPEALAENSGMDSIATVANARSDQENKSCPYIGVDCMGVGTNNLLEQHVHESAHSKRNQLALATQVVKMLLKIDDVIEPAEITEEMN